MENPEKKILLFLVEGSTDSTSLGLVMSRLVETADVRFAVLGGDLCYRYRITAENAARTVMRPVNGFLQRYRLKKSDLIQIVHVIDTDGAFIPPTRVFHGGDERAHYAADKIVTLSDESMRARNEMKTCAAEALSGLRSVEKIPYAFYFFPATSSTSCTAGRIRSPAVKRERFPRNLRTNMRSIRNRSFRC